MVRWILPFFVLSCFASKYDPKYFDSQSVSHLYFSLGYDKEIEGARWTHHLLQKRFITGSAKRKNNFRVDSFVNGLSAYASDYRGSGLDRGHLVPAADMKLNKVSMSESFYMSNISPQHPSLNRGRWSVLERKVRNWCLAKGELHVFTGPVFLNSYTRINGTNIAIPDGFYKVIFKETHKEAIAFFMPNKKLYGDIIQFSVNVDYIEEMTNIDFFSELPDFIEKRVESQVNLDYWN